VQVDLEEMEGGRKGAKEIAPRRQLLLLLLEESLFRHNPDPCLKLLQLRVAVSEGEGRRRSRMSF
jgi:hypothetical protein